MNTDSQGSDYENQRGEQRERDKTQGSIGGIPSDTRRQGDASGDSLDDSLGSGPSTESMETDRSVSPPPESHDPVDDLKEQFQKAKKRRRPRDAIKSFVDWQLRSVSKQSAEQRAYHMCLKRKIRKKASRDNAREKHEEDALRIARLAPLIDDKERENHGRAGKGDWEGDFVGPDFMRLPLESYLPRRVSKYGSVLSPEEVEAGLPVVQSPYKLKTDAQQLVNTTKASVPAEK